MKRSLKSVLLGNVILELPANSTWKATLENTSPAQEVEVLDFLLEAPAPDLAPALELSFSIPLAGAQFRWTADGRSGLPIWHTDFPCRINAWLPLISYLKADSTNRITFALSETLRESSLSSGAYVVEGDCLLKTVIKLPSTPGERRKAFKISLRVDARAVNFSTSVRDAAAWLDGIAGTPLTTPPSAHAAFYSTWYGYWSKLTAKEVEEEGALAKALGIDGLLVDDGWHTDKNTETYAAGGAWQASPAKFPDMRGHVEKIHALGLKYLPWIGTPILGDECAAAKRFAGKTLRRLSDFAILDPRFPEVREYLVSRLEEALREWNLDGFKLDYIEWFSVEGEDPAVKEDYAGRDIKALPLAIDALLSVLIERLRAVKPELLIEFRQAYIGPAARKYGNIMRVGDCPGDLLANRKGLINLRLTSGRSAIHSDMLTWSLSDPPETAALQLLNALFGTPQLSMRLAALPEAHRRMVKFWLGFMKRNRKLLLDGTFTALHPELNYPLAQVEDDTAEIIVPYASEQLVEIEGKPGKTYHVVNASGSGQLFLKLARKPSSATLFSTCGEERDALIPSAGLLSLDVPPAGLLTLKF